MNTTTDNKSNTPEVQRPIRKISEHLTDASYHVINVEGMTDADKRAFMFFLDEAWKLVKAHRS